MKKISKFWKLILVVITILVTGIYFYTKNYWKYFTTEEKVSELIFEIKKAEKLPEIFYEIYEVENPNSLTYDLNRQMFNSLYDSKFIKPPSSFVAVMFREFWNEKSSFHRFKVREISLSWKIESSTTQKECLNWVLEIFDFNNGAKGINQASIKYFEKHISELNKREVASLIIIMKNPALYNPIRRKELVERKVDTLMGKIK